MDEASRLLRDECTRLGGSGVVGVDVELRVASHHIDLTLTGTAVRRIGAATPSFEFVSDLSARDFVLLTRSGWWPLGLAAGASFVVAPRRSARAVGGPAGAEHRAAEPHRSALPRPREGDGADAAVRDGDARRRVVGVKLREGPLGYNARVMQFVAIGTGVHLREDAHRTIDPTMVVTLDERVREFDIRKLRSGGPAT